MRTRSTVLASLLAASHAAAADCPSQAPFRLLVDAPSARNTAGGDRSLDLVAAPGATVKVEVTAYLESNPPDRSVTVDACGLFGLFAEHDRQILLVESVADAGSGVGFFGGRAVESDAQTGFVAGAGICLGPVPVELHGRMPLVTATYSLATPLAPVGTEMVTTIRLGSFRGDPPSDSWVQWNGQVISPCLEHLTLRISVRESAAFVRGDTNFDHRLDISDPVSVLQTLFHGNPLVRCEDAADANDSGSLDISDAVFVFAYLFLGGTPPGDPFPDAGPDRTGDGLGCTAAS